MGLPFSSYEHQMCRLSFELYGSRTTAVPSVGVPVTANTFVPCPASAAFLFTKWKQAAPFPSVILDTGCQA